MNGFGLTRRHVPRWRRLGFIALMSPISSGCVSMSTETSVSVWSHEDRTFISVEVPTNEVSFNWHGGGWTNGLDRYKLTLPRKADAVDGGRIVVNRGIGATDRVVSVSPDSRVELDGDGRCRVHIRLYDAAGKPYALNGTYFLHRSCGR